MFKLNDKKHRKRALMKLNGCKPNCGANGDQDEAYEVSNGQKVTNKTIETAIQYNLDEAPSHLVRKTMKFEEVHYKENVSGVDEVDRAGSAHSNRQLLIDFPSLERNAQSKVVSVRSEYGTNVEVDQGMLGVLFKCSVSPRIAATVVVSSRCSIKIDFGIEKYL